MSGKKTNHSRYSLTIKVTATCLNVRGLIKWSLVGAALLSNVCVWSIAIYSSRMPLCFWDVNSYCTFIISSMNRIERYDNTFRVRQMRYVYHIQFNVGFIHRLTSWNKSEHYKAVNITCNVCLQKRRFLWCTIGSTKKTAENGFK